MKILLLNTQMEAAGAQKALLSLARGLEDRRNQITVVTMYDKGGFVSKFNQRYSLDIVDLQMKRPGVANPIQKLGFALGGLVRLYRLMKSERFDVVQTFSHYSNIIGPLLAWLAGVPIRVSSQRMSLRGAPRWLLLLDRLVANSALVHKMTAVSEGTRQFALKEQKINPDKVVTIYNGVNVHRYNLNLSSVQAAQLRRSIGIEEGAPVVITVARLHPQKGHKYLLEAIPNVRLAIPDVHFLFVGAGELEGDLRAQIQEMGLDECVHLLGVRQDIPELLSLSDLFVLPSLWEGLPNAVLEAMAAELPVVATDVDGSPELVVHGKTGLLVPPSNSQTLTSAIIELLCDRNLLVEMGEAAKKRAAEYFSVEKNITDYLELYDYLLSSK